VSLDETELLVCSLHKPECLEDIWSEFRNHIQNVQVLSLLEAAWKYKRITKGGMLTRQALSDMLPNDTAKREQYLALYDDATARVGVCPKAGNCDTEFAWLMALFQRHYKEKEIGKALAASMETLSSGYLHNGVMLKGPDAAIKVFHDMSSRSVFGNTLVTAVQSDRFAENVQKVYSEMKTNSRTIRTGFDIIDAHTLGILPTNLVLVAAYAGEGKSFALLNMGHHALTKQHCNVAIATGEMSVEEYWCRLLALHSYHLDPQRILRTQRIARGILDDEEERQLFQVVIPDLANNPVYGKLFIWQFMQNETIDTLVRRMVSLPEQIDVLIIDYMSLLSSSQKRVQRNEEVNDIIREAKNAAIGAYNGRGVVIFSGFQTKRSAWEEAQKEHKYTKTAFAESAEAERSADLAFWLLEEDAMSDQLKGGIMKYRHGSTSLSEFWLTRHFDYAFLSSPKEEGGMSRGGADINQFV
jgi:hypothetical protein